MASVQRLRQEASNAGNLETTPQQEVVADDGNIEIWPAQAQYCYLPIYDPSLVFFGSGGVFGGPVITFGPGLPIGVWLNIDFDWRHRRIYYHGWSEGRGWIALSRPYIHLNSVYMNDSLKNVSANRSVTNRVVNYGNLARYDGVHRNAAYINPGGVNNKIIERNGDVGDTRIDMYRGRAPETPAAAPVTATEHAGNSAFGGNRGDFGAKAASQRGQSSRSQAAHPAPAPRSSGGGGSHAGGGGGGSHGGGGGRH
jgi:hypothetical protein